MSDVTDAALEGHNTIDLNQATMKKIVQEYFDRHAPNLGLQIQAIRNNPTNGTVSFTIETVRKDIEGIF
jgi:hypothetical protein